MLRRARLRAGRHPRQLKPITYSGTVAMNDVSQRAWQQHTVGGLWDLGKSGVGWAAFAPFFRHH